MARLRMTYGTIPNQAARFHVDMCSLRRNVEERHEPRLFGVHTVTTPTNEAQAKRLRTVAAVMQAFIASRYRTTSRQADEYICIASLLGWDTSGLSSVPIDKRMKFLLFKAGFTAAGYPICSGAARAGSRLGMGSDKVWQSPNPALCRAPDQRFLVGEKE